MARATKLHPPHTSEQVDALDVAVVAMLLGVRPESTDPDGLTGDFAADSAALIAQRQAAAAAAARSQAS